MTTEERQSHVFQAEVTELLHLVIHSLYSHKEIFLRELVSNAADAVDRLRFRAISEPSLLEDGTPMEIRISADEAAGTLTIEDTGVGMTKDELAENLGTIARSGTKAFVEKLKAAGKSDVNLIGQFGVGFYSAYLVADRVDVVSRSADSREAFRWSSDAKQSFTIEPATRVERGTAVVLHLKEDCREFLDGWRLREVIRRYSDYVAVSIKLKEKKGDTESWDQVNRGSALWQRSPSDVTKEQAEELYKHITHDFDPPLAYSHFRIEGTLLFTGMLFIPKKQPFDSMMGERKRGVRLYVKRVFILEDVEELVPAYLRFVRGVVDSDDLPLNVSRELLQDSSIVRTMKKAVVKRTLDRLEEMSKEAPDDYLTFWESFGPVLKEGIAIDDDQRTRIAGLSRFKSTKAEAWTSLADYIARMSPDQPAIYYAIGESIAALSASPHLEALRKRGFEVLLLTDPVDEWCVDALAKYEGKDLVSAMRANLDLGDAKEAEAKSEIAKGELAPLLAKIKEILGTKIGDVRVSTRLTDSAACLVVPEGGHHAPMEQLLRAAGRNLPATKRIFEVNPDHPLVKHLLLRTSAAGDTSKLNDWVETLYDQAVLVEGGKLEDPAGFARRITSLLEAASAGS